MVLISSNRNARLMRERRHDGGARGAFEAEAKQLGLEPRVETERVWMMLPGEGPVPQGLDVFTGWYEEPRNLLARIRKMYLNDEPAQLSAGYIPKELAAGGPLEMQDTGEGGALSRLEELLGVTLKFTEHIRLATPMEDSMELEFLQRTMGLAVRRIAFTPVGRPVMVDACVVGGDWELSYSIGDW